MSFQDVLNRGTLIQGAIALIVVVTVCVLILNGKDVPPSLVSLLGIVVGFYFGQHVTLSNGSS